MVSLGKSKAVGNSRQGFEGREDSALVHGSLASKPSDLWNPFSTSTARSPHESQKGGSLSGCWVCWLKSFGVLSWLFCRATGRGGAGDAVYQWGGRDTPASCG